MSGVNLKFWISEIAGIALALGLALGNAGDQGLIDKDTKHYKWIMWVVGSGGVISLLLTGADKNKPWLPGTVESAPVKEPEQ
jgi:hypothetical protein